jgi:hypothetical protein
VRRQREREEWRLRVSKNMIRRKGSKQVAEDDALPASSEEGGEIMSRRDDKAKNSDTASDSSKSEKHHKKKDRHKKEKEVKKSTKDEKKKKKKKEGKANWGCVDSCCWLIGYVCVIWWFLAVVYNALPSTVPQYMMEKISGPIPDAPGVTLKKDGLQAKHPVVFVPGIVTGGLELWEGKPCAHGLFRKRLWGGTFGEIYKRYAIPSDGSCVPTSTSVNCPDSSAITPCSHRCQSSHGLFWNSHIILVA